jgi:hypothetical protein
MQLNEDGALWSMTRQSAPAGLISASNCKPSVNTISGKTIEGLRYHTLQSSIGHIDAEQKVLVLAGDIFRGLTIFQVDTAVQFLNYELHQGRCAVCIAMKTDNISCPTHS